MNARWQIQVILNSSNFPPRCNKKNFSRTPFYLPWDDQIGQKGGERKIEKSSSTPIPSMGQFFPPSSETGSVLSIDSDNEALGRVRNAVIEALEKWKVRLRPMNGSNYPLTLSKKTTRALDLITEQRIG